MNRNGPTILPATSGDKSRTRRSRASSSTWLMIAMVMFFSIGRYIPGFEWTLNMIGVASFVTALLMRRSPLPSLMRATRTYIWIFVIFVPLWGATMAQLVFGQPFWLGLATQRGYLLILFVLVVGNLIQQGRLTLQNIESSLVKLAWINLVICTTILIFLDPNDYSDIGNLVTDGGGLYNQFVLPMPFIVFGAFYYFARWGAGKNRQCLLMSLPFFLYIFGGGAGTGRVFSLAILLSILLITRLARRRKGESFRNVILIIAVVSVLTAITAAIAPERVSSFMGKYVDAFAALFGADNVDDWSANARIVQVATVMPWVEHHPLLGTGAISNRWNDGYKGMFEYLHPSDLGFLGIVFVYGLVGLAFFTIQYRLAWRTISAFANRARDTSTQPFLLGCCGCLTTLLFTALTTGSIAFNAEQILFYMMLIQAGVHFRTYRHE